MTVYFLRQKDTDFVKIGWTLGNPKRRIHALQTGNPCDLELIAVSHKESEKFFHETYKSDHIRGEWYRLNANDLVPRDDLIFMPPLYVARIGWEMSETILNRNPPHYIADEYPWGTELDGTPKPMPNPMPDIVDTFRRWFKNP